MSDSETKTKVIKFYSRNAYGREHLYLAAPNLARRVKSLTKKTTVSKSDLRSLCAITGADCEQVATPPR